MIIKTRSKSFINQDFKDAAADRCYFKLRWKCHIITITIYAVHGSTPTVILRGRSKNCGFVWKRRTCSLLAISRWKGRRRILLIHALKRCLTSVADRLEGNQRASRESKWLCLKSYCGTSREGIFSKGCFQLGWPTGNRTGKYRGVYGFLGFFAWGIGGFLWSVWPSNLNCKSGDNNVCPSTSGISIKNWM